MGMDAMSGMSGESAILGGGGGAAPFVYPTLSIPLGQLMWIDENKAYKDAGTTLAANGDAIQTIKLPVGWDNIGGTKILTQGTLANRALKTATGINPNGTSTAYPFPANLALTTLTYYWISSSNAGDIGVGLATDGSIGYQDGFYDNTDNNLYIVGLNAVPGLIVYNPPSDRTLCIRRVRCDGSTAFYKKPGTAESSGAFAGSVSINSFLYRTAMFSANTFFYRQGVLLNWCVADGDADDAKVIAALRLRVPTATGP